LNLRDKTDVRTEKNRRSEWLKVVDLIFRSWHIGTSSVFFGGVFFLIPFARLAAWHHLALATGVIMIIFNTLKSRHWPYQGRGAAALLHVCVVWSVHLWPGQAVPVLSTALALGVIGSHMPGSIRHWSLVHGRRID
jgi:hypothetical protein